MKYNHVINFGYIGHRVISSEKNNIKVAGGKPKLKNGNIQTSQVKTDFFDRSPRQLN